MAFLVDTGILLRLVNRSEPLHATVRSAIRTLKARGETLITAHQNVAEFWNVCTRPASARGGYGLSIEETAKRLRLLERVIPVLLETVASYPLWKTLVVAQAVQGVQAHDARLVAFMLSHGVANLLTLNEGDFKRYMAIEVFTPASILD
jgi:predicted nucleic acid-binding protein